MELRDDKKTLTSGEEERRGYIGKNKGEYMLN